MAARRLWPFGLYRLTGGSMLPAYAPGDTLLGWRWFGQLQPGWVVVAWQDGRPLIKRVARVDGQHVWLLGDNAAASTDSRHFGALHRRHVEAVIKARL